MKALALAILFGYAQLVVHQAGHGHGQGGPAHAHQCRAQCEAKEHGAALGGDGHAGATAKRLAREGGEAGHHGHKHVSHQHPSLISRAPQDGKAELPQPPVFAISSVSFEFISAVPEAIRLTAIHAPPRGPTYLENLVLRI